MENIKIIFAIHVLTAHELLSTTSNGLFVNYLERSARWL